MNWEDGYDEFLKSAHELNAWDIRPSYIIGWIDHPILPGKFIADLKYIFHGNFH